MFSAPTFHNKAVNGDISKTVLMPGDPLRARYIAENYLQNAVEFNNIRGMLGYTGEYNNCQVSVMASGIGMPSMGIYSYELFAFYDVENIIRIGTAAGMHKDLRLRDIVFAAGTSTNSNYAAQYKMDGTFAPIASFSLLRAAVETAEKKRVPHMVGNVLSSDYFYVDEATKNLNWIKMNVLAVEMESGALYMNAARFGKNALAILTISDLVATGEVTTAEERQTSFSEMIEVALETVLTIQGMDRE